jgi:hypothetical protein
VAPGEWVIIGTAAVRDMPGRFVIVSVGAFPTIQAAIEDWERQEAARQTADLQQLGVLVDRAMKRLKCYPTPPRERHLDTGDIQ